MGKGICMTPPPPLLTTNSSFNTSNKFPDLLVTQFLNLVHFHPSFRIMRLLLETYGSDMKHSVKHISLLVTISLTRYGSSFGTAAKTYLFEKAMTVKLNLLAMQFILWFTSCKHLKVVTRCSWASLKAVKQRDQSSAD